LRLKLVYVLAVKNSYASDVIVGIADCAHRSTNVVVRLQGINQVGNRLKYVSRRRSKQLRSRLVDLQRIVLPNFYFIPASVAVVSHAGGVRGARHKGLHGRST